MRQGITLGGGLAVCAIAIVMATQSQSSSPSKLSSSTPKYVQMTGVNLAGAEFGTDKLPGQFGTNYIYPLPATVDYFATKGMSVARLSVRWERVQYRLGDALYEPEMRRIDGVVAHAASKGMKIILDVHNHATYHGSVIGSEKVSVSAFADLWRQIAARYRNKDSVIFGLMHAPTGLETETWLGAVNLAIAEIRKADANNLVLVAGNGGSSARDWTSSYYGTPNSDAMLKVVDPRDNFMYETHQFFDEKFAGASADCQSATVAVDALKSFTDWARRNGKRGFLGQFGVGSNKNCLDVLNRVLSFMGANNDVWYGWTYWAAGHWWDKDFFSSIQPIDGQDRPQMSVLSQHIKPSLPQLDGKE